MKVPTMVRLEVDLKQAAELRAESEGRSLSNLVAVAVRRYLDQPDAKPAAALGKPSRAAPRAE